MTWFSRFRWVREAARHLPVLNVPAWNQARHERTRKRDWQFCLLRAYAVHLLEAKHYGRAERVVRAALRMGGEDPQALHVLGQIHSALGELHEARTCYELAYRYATQPERGQAKFPGLFVADILVDDAAACAMLHQRAETPEERGHHCAGFVACIRRAAGHDHGYTQEAVAQLVLPPELRRPLDVVLASPAKERRKVRP